MKLRSGRTENGPGPDLQLLLPERTFPHTHPNRSRLGALDLGASLFCKSTFVRWLKHFLRLPNQLTPSDEGDGH